MARFDSSRHGRTPSSLWPHRFCIAEIYGWLVYYGLATHDITPVVEATLRHALAHGRFPPIETSAKERYMADKGAGTCVLLVGGIT